MNTQTMDTTALLDQVCEMLPQAGLVPLQVCGNSMSPFLVHQRDMVYLSPVSSRLRRGDIALYRRDSGAYIMHRVCRLEAGRYCFVGDAQTYLEHGVREDQIRAVVVAADRKGRREQAGTFWWEFFRTVWVRVVPLRPFLLRIYGGFTRLARKKE